MSPHIIYPYNLPLCLCVASSARPSLSHSRTCCWWCTRLASSAVRRRTQPMGRTRGKRNPSCGNSPGTRSTPSSPIYTTTSSSHTKLVGLVTGSSLVLFLCCFVLFSSSPVYTLLSSNHIQLVCWNCFVYNKFIVAIFTCYHRSEKTGFDDNER